MVCAKVYGRCAVFEISNPSDWEGCVVVIDALMMFNRKILTSVRSSLL